MNEKQAQAVKELIEQYKTLLAKTEHYQKLIAAIEPNIKDIPDVTPMDKKKMGSY